MNTQKQWWVPVWKGLIIDQDAVHYQRMKNALWLYLYLLLNADRKTGTLKRKIKTISVDMGVSRDTVIRWLTILRKGEYIKTKNTGRCLFIQINKWKGLPDVRDMPLQKLEISNTRDWKNPTSQTGSQGQNPQYLSQESPSSLNPNDISIKRNILNIDIDNKNTGNFKTFNGFRPTTREELLALDLAEALDDQDGLPLYLSYAKKYPEGLLRQILGEVRDIPLNRIRKSRGALFNYLVKKHMQDTSRGDMK